MIPTSYVTIYLNSPKYDIMYMFFFELLTHIYSIQNKFILNYFFFLEYKIIKVITIPNKKLII